MNLDRYEGDWELAMDAYNKGNAVSKHTEYVRRAKKKYKEIFKQALLPEVKQNNVQIN